VVEALLADVCAAFVYDRVVAADHLEVRLGGHLDDLQVRRDRLAGLLGPVRLLALFVHLVYPVYGAHRFRVLYHPENWRYLPYGHAEDLGAAE
tara:strand:+ start:1790 stop:2068 length:279 start_codon:yes stop_codon:yes gene_type:complete